MMLKSLDGVEVEVMFCDAGYPPGSPNRSLMLNTMAVWCKPTDGEWIRSPYRSSMKTCEVIKNTKAKDLVGIFTVKELSYDGTESSSDSVCTATTTELQPEQGHSAGDADQ